MTKQRATFGLVIAVLGVAAWGLWALLEEPGRTPAPQPGAGGAALTEGPEMQGVALPGASTGTRGAVESAPFDPKAREREELGALHVPDHGPRLERDQETVAIALLDSRGHPLSRIGWRTTHHRAFAVHGSYGTSLPTKFDGNTSIMTVGNTVRSVGPGRHELRVDFGSYGPATMTWTGRPAEGTASLRLPGHRRIVTLEFVDPDGNPIPWITTPPRFIPRSGKWPGSMPEAPNVLRDAPGREHFGSLGMSGGSMSGPRGRTRNTKYPTDGGRWYLPVVAGVGGKIQIDLDKRVFTERRIELESDFVGGEWDARPVVLAFTEEASARLERYRTSRRTTPGNRTALEASWPPIVAPANSQSSTAPVSPHDTSDMVKGRVRWLVNDPGPGQPRPYRMSKRTRPEAFRGWPDGRLSFDHRRKFPPLFAWSDHMLHHGPVHEIAHDDRPVHEITFGPDASPATLEFRTTPTLAAWSRATTMLVRGTMRPIGDWRVLRHAAPATRFGTSFLYESSISSLGRERLLGPEEADGHFEFAIHAGSTSPMEILGGQLRTSGRRLTSHLTLGAEDRKALHDGQLTIDLTARLVAQGTPVLLTYRAIDPLGSGLPFVQASVIPGEEDALARALRDLEQRWSKRKVRPGAGHLQARDEEEEISVETEEFDSRYPARIRANVDYHTSNGEDSHFYDDPRPWPGIDVVREQLGAELVDGLDERLLRRLWDRDAWYDTRRKVTGDRDGFVVTTSTGLEPGKTYVLYLWSRSRDDLRPDRRIVFEATPGITDLGVLELPAY